jgi:hypothetical protein
MAMKKDSLFYKIFLVMVMLLNVITASAQVTPPAGWGDFQLGLVNDNSNIINVRMKKALSENVKLSYRYAYVNNGVDPNTNALSWLFNQWGTDYSRNSSEMGLRPAYVIYMLQEEGGAAALKNNIQNTAFMRNYFTSIRTVAEKSNGYKAIFVIEPDTWGYFLQNALEQGLQSDPTQVPANVSNLGAGYEHLNGLPNNLSGVAQGVIKTIRRYAPDAYCGLLMSFWSVNANGATGPAVPDGAKGMVYWNQSDVDYSAQRNATFANQLLSGATDRGDFIGVEKNGWSAGNWLVKQNRNDYYWNDIQNAKWVSWSKTLRQNVNLPLLGWQISIGHLGLPNTVNRYEDTFMPYFFSHVAQFMDAGFIGFLAGKGLADCTDFTNLNGNELEANGSAGDDGWFFEKVKTFDAGRPYLGTTVGPSVTIISPANGATFTPGSSVVISAHATGGTNCAVTRVEFYQGSIKLGEDLASPYSITWAAPPAGSYSLTARVFNSCGASAISPAVIITGNNPAPIATITAPTNNAVYTAPATINITVNAADTSPGTVASVSFYNGATLLGTDTSSPYSFSWANVAAGTYSLTARATDNQGALGTSSVITVVVNEQGQGIPGTIQSESYATMSGIQLEATTDTGGGQNVGWIDANDWMDYTVNVATGGQYTVSYRVASLNGGGSVQVRSGSTTLATTSVPSTGAWQTWTTITSTSFTLAAGTQTLRIFAGTGGFNLNWMQFATVTNITAPTASITAPANNTNFAAPATITISANASDVAPGTVSSVSFYSGSTLLGTDNTSPYAFTWTNVTAGTYTLTARATDNQGATGTSAVVNITVTAGNSPPTTSITAPANNASFTAPASITINANASDANGTIAKVEFFNGTTKLGEDLSSPYSFSWTNVAAGSYTITTRATDNAGATGTSAVVNITVTGGSGCSYPQYIENGGYVAGSLVKNAGTWYECKPHPFTGWCNGAAWAYAPGTGAYWSDAWILKGSCSARADVQPSESKQEIAVTDGLAIFPNPGKTGSNNLITMSFDTEPGEVRIQVRSMSGAAVSDLPVIGKKNTTIKVEVPSLPAGVYLLKVSGQHRYWFRKYVLE